MAMARKKAGSRRPPAAPSAPKYPRLVESEPDPQWQRWFKEVELRRQDRRDPGKRKWVFNKIQKEDGVTEFFRKKSEPVPFKQIIRLDEKKTGRKVTPDLLAVAELWEATVGADIASESAIYSLKNGILTVNIFSSGLLQEIRQFHQAAIEQDLRDVWNLSMPLVRITYRLGKRKT